MTHIAHVFYDKAIALFMEGKTKEAAAAIDAAIEASPLSEDALHLRLIKASAIEYGEWVGERDQRRAYHEYSQLEQWVEILGEDGLNVYLGAARTLYRIDAVRNAEEIERLLSLSIAHGRNPHVEMLLGLLNETALLNTKVARSHYLEAFKMRLPWGLRFYARSHMADRNYVRGIVAHTIATAVSPVMIMMFGARGVLHENPWL